ncbi:type II toxin-antitoxin system RelE/ParE family toxin [Sodalis ligni]|uniref:ParE-like toxin of type II ParDE toxin-antitoxin system n=1 Tax=Sodalis ligni TaxID=2697027 RepID=A0A4R1NHV9_9GAMM|nr:type II toxin-antitoxin system RelE/ParE family toxin [Sodalis ligni]TCL04326.1 ParE-like toxin of type II ParDE toxin-antitoxin system [Sodalis ligni]
MPEGQAGRRIDVYETRRFSKALAKLPRNVLAAVEDEIDAIIADPSLGEQKKGDLRFLQVHKFSLNNQLMLIGYSWIENRLELYLLSFGTHENFYLEQKIHRKADLKLIE